MIRRICNYHSFDHARRYLAMTGLGLGRVKTLCRKGEDGRELAFSGFDYARIAAISGWMPMIFITRVRL